MEDGMGSMVPHMFTLSFTLVVQVLTYLHWGYFHHTCVVCARLCAAIASSALIFPTAAIDRH